MLDGLEPRLRKKTLNALCKICHRQAHLPNALHIPLCYNRFDDPVYSGGYADVWMGEHQGGKVAVKVLRIFSTSDLDEVTKVGRSQSFPVVWHQRTDCGFVEVLQGSHDVEKPPPSKRASVVGSDNGWQAFRDDIGMDGQWEHK